MGCLFFIRVCRGDKKGGRGGISLGPKNSIPAQLLRERLKGDQADIPGDYEKKFVKHRSINDVASPSSNSYQKMVSNL